MIKTSICVYPGDDNGTEYAFNFIEEYCRICNGVLPKNNDSLTVFCGDQKYNFQRINFGLTADSKSKSLLVAISHLVSTSPKSLKVGRLIIVSNDLSPFPCSPNASLGNYLYEWLTKMLSIFTQHCKFHSLNLDLIVFQNGLENDIEKWSDDKTLHIVVKNPANAEEYAKTSAYSHLKLSRFKYRAFKIFFLNAFEQMNIEVSSVKYQLPEDLIPPVEVSYPCIILDKKMPVKDELANNIIIFDHKWLLSSLDGNCSLSKLGEPFDNDMIDRYSFSIPSTANRLIIAMPQKLIISPTGDNWVFSRTSPSPAMASMTTIAKFDDSNLILFTPQFLGNNKALSIVAPIMGAVSKPMPNQVDIQLASQAIAELFNVLTRNPHEILAQNIAENNTMQDLILRLVLEIKFVLHMFEPASAGHKALFDTFAGRESMISSSQYAQH